MRATFMRSTRGTATTARCGRPAWGQVCGWRRVLLALVAVLLVLPGLAASAAAATARIDGRIAWHQAEKQRLLGVAPREAALTRSVQGLKADTQREVVALYVRSRLTAAEQGELARLGVTFATRIWIPPLVKPFHPFGYHVAEVPYAQLSRVAAHPAVVELTSLEIASRPHNNLARSATQVLAMQQGWGVPQTDGTGVKVCIADSGVDLTHPDFSEPFETFDVTTGSSTDDWATGVANTVSDHGTHVAGTVVGSGQRSGGLYRGMAPGASWAFYKIGDNVTSNTTDAEEIEALNRSVAVGCTIFTMSYGGLGNDVDGSGPVSQAIDTAVAAGMTVFVSAGNEAAAGQHVTVTVPAQSSLNVTLTVGSTAATPATLVVGLAAFWRDGNPADGNVTLTGWVGSATAGATPRGTEFLRMGQQWNSVFAGAAFGSTITLNNAAATPATVDIYTWPGNGNTTSVIASPTPTANATISSPAVADGAIAVGAWTSRTSWTDGNGNTQSVPSLTQNTLAPFSSQGPRIDGVRKPEFVAPGAMIISAADSVVLPPAGMEIDDDGQNLDGSGPASYRVMAGTSMATPVAAGAAVLLKQRVPTATPAYIRAVMNQTATQADDPDSQRGSGMILIKDAVLHQECGDGVVQGNEACDDGNVDPDDCCLTNCTLGQSCDDGNPCTTGDFCAGDTCLVSGAVDCSDGNLCTGDYCSAPMGCWHAPLSGSGCSDGDVCTQGDQCVLGNCSGTAVSCDDGNPCTADSCTPVIGCTNLPAAGSCDDGDACTVSDTCLLGTCSGLAKFCSDDDGCTLDSCQQPNGQCIHVGVSSGPCEDGLSCTSNDTCTDAGCVGQAVDCDDGDLCTSDLCLPGPGTCTHTVKGMICNDNNPCTTDGCQPQTGSCGNVPRTGDCEDGNACTLADSCVGTACVGGQKDCNDNNPCTLDDCDGATGECYHINTALACDDGDPWTMNDKCGGGSCQGQIIPCDDGVACTWNDRQTALGCVGTPASCDDGQPCTTDVCLEQYGGSCNSYPTPCLDANDCTADSCDPQTGDCVYEVLDGTPCYDPYWCTLNDTCQMGACVGTPKVCADDDPCTDDLCNEPGGGGCYFAANTAPCDDGKACTTADVCADGGCHGQPVVCSDGNPCTTDACDPVKGCVSTVPLASYPPCDDGEPCTTDTFCWEGTCTGGNLLPCNDGLPCTADSCVPGSGCVHTLDSLLCGDGNACTVDECTPMGGCNWLVLDATPCPDNQGCTTNERCVSGVCVVDQVDCTDADPCTLDWCGYLPGGDPGGACQHTAQTDCTPPDADATADADTGEADADEWDATAGPDVVEPDASETDAAAETDALEPDVVQADAAAGTDATEPDVPMPDAVFGSDADEPDAGEPEVAEPDVAETDAAVGTDATEPDVPAPDVTMPDAIFGSDADEPEVSEPDVAQTDAAPGTDATEPDVTMPDAIFGSDADEPEVAEPDVAQTDAAVETDTADGGGFADADPADALVGADSSAAADVGEVPQVNHSNAMCQAGRQGREAAAGLAVAAGLVVWWRRRRMAA